MSKKIFQCGIVIFLIGILLIQPTGMISVNAASSGEASTASLRPRAKSPKGLIFDRTPTFKWTKIANATAYKIQVFKGTRKIYNKTFGPLCGATLCVKTPGKRLGYATFRWRVRAKVNGSWRRWSRWKKFTINNPNVPKPIAPTVKTYDTTPTFTWTKAKSVQRYQLQVYKGDTRIYTATYGPKCSGTTCSKTPTTALTYEDYKWRVRVRKKSGVWKKWSVWRTFTVADPTPLLYFNFNTTHPGWTEYGGTWVHDGQVYKSAGVIDAWSNIGYDTKSFGTVTFEARVRRVGGENSYPARLIIRGTPLPLNTNLGRVNDWASGYAFQYADNGTFSVYRIDTDTPLPGGSWATPVPTNPIKKYDWNILKVVASGSSMKFYINNTLVWSGTDTTFSSGKVGIGYYWKGSASTLEVDWATISDNAADMLFDEQVAPGVEIPGGSSTFAPNPE